MPDVIPPTQRTLIKYGLTPDGYLALCAACNYTCVVCGQPFGDRKLAIDHEPVKGWNAHKKRKGRSVNRIIKVSVMTPAQRRPYVRGVIHNYCNRFIRRWLTLERARAIVAYLEAYHRGKEEAAAQVPADR